MIFMMQNSKIKTTELERKVNELGKENDDLRNENNILQHAVDGLGLEGLSDFDTRSSIIELALRGG